MQQPDILFIVLDTQRADRLGCYGHPSAATGNSISANVDAFASQATLFERAISPAQWTIPSHASMFTGLYPTAHQVTQSNQSLSPDRPHLAEMLQASGYQTVGFCNNPLVGILNNGFKRGFEVFYNYGGAIPSMPRSSTRLPWPISWLLEGYTQFLRHISYPIQNFFGRSDLAFRLSLNAWLTPLWSKMANFKGQNERSSRDVTRFLLARENKPSATRRPLFLFLNLMETHLPFWPPGEFVDRIAPYMKSDREARSVMRRWNREAYLWQTPLAEPLSELESRVLNDMYDAEVAYQDDYLGSLFEAIHSRANAENTLTVVVSDHGDGLGEHGYFGHAFVAYQELIHVPLMLHWPARVAAGRRISAPVSTRRIYHTILDASGATGATESDIVRADRHPSGINDLTQLSLKKTSDEFDPEDGTAFAEIFPPLNFAKAIQHRQPELLQRFRCLETRRAVIQNDWKMIQISDHSEELFDLATDPVEHHNKIAEQPTIITELGERLNDFLQVTEAERHEWRAGDDVNLESDEQLMQRLRGLGYIE